MKEQNGVSRRAPPFGQTLQVTMGLTKETVGLLGRCQLRRRQRSGRMSQPVILASTQPMNGFGKPAGCVSRRKNRRVIASLIVNHRNVSFADDLAWFKSIEM